MAGAPVPLGLFARLCNIASSAASFDWAAVVSVIRHFAELSERRIQLGRDSGLALPPEEQPEVVRRTCVSRQVPWLLRLADRVYSFVPDAFWEELGPTEPPLALALVGEDHGPAPGWATYCEWAEIPDIERLLFEQYDETGIERRLAAGIWRPYAETIRLPINEPDWYETHLVPTS